MSDTEKKQRGRPRKNIQTDSENEIKQKKPKGRPRTDMPLSIRRKLYDLRFSLKKLNMTDKQMDEVITLINKLKAETDAKQKEEQAKLIEELHEKKDK